MRVAMMWCLTIGCFIGVIVALGRWLDDGGYRPVVVAFIMIVLFLVCLPTEDES